MDLANHYESRIRYPTTCTWRSRSSRCEARAGAGSGRAAVTKRYWRDYPELRVDSVEIDPVVVDVAHKYFDVTRTTAPHLYEDARRFVQRTSETYDIVIVDAYYADSMPFHLTTDEFFREVKARSRPTASSRTT